MTAILFFNANFKFEHEKRASAYMLIWAACRTNTVDLFFAVQAKIYENYENFV